MTFTRCQGVHRFLSKLFEQFFFFSIDGNFFAGDMDIRIANKYRLGRKIGGGSFGDIYVGKL